MAQRSGGARLPAGQAADFPPPPNGTRRIDISISGDGAVFRARRHGALALYAEIASGGRALAERLSLVRVPMVLGNRRFEVTAVGAGAAAHFVLDRIGRGTGIDAARLPGLPRAVQGVLETTIDARSGLVIAAGPANSGKRTILGAIGGAIDARVRAMWVIAADPVDPLAQVEHHRIDAATRLEVVRAAAKVAPDIVILDRIDTPEVARAAVTLARERLVVATLDAADAVGAIAALIALRVDRFDLAATLNAIVARRPARRLCPECARPIQASGSVSALLGFDRGAVVHVADGCGACDGSGSAGTIGVFEAIAVDMATRRLIDSGGDSAILARHAFLNVPNLGSAARALVRDGVIAAEEAVRLSRSPAPDTPVARRAELSLWGAP